MFDCLKIRSFFSSSSTGNSNKPQSLEIGVPTNFTHVFHADMNSLDEYNDFIEKQKHFKSINSPQKTNTDSKNEYRFS